MSKLFRWAKGRQDTGYEKFTLFFSKWLEADAYILKIPKGVAIPPHTDYVPHAQHYRINVTVRGHLRMETNKPVFRLGDWYSFFRPDDVLHWADPVKKPTYILSIGWLKS